jgi:hypothetical protein
MSLNEKTQCLKCPHERYEHIDWKLDTSYANNHTGCRIAGCECAAFDTTPTVRMADEGYCEYLSNHAKWLIGFRTIIERGVWQK